MIIPPAPHSGQLGCASGMEYLGAVCILWVHPSIHLKAHLGAGAVLIPGVWGLRRLRSLHPPGARSQEPGARSQDPAAGTRAKPR